MPRPYSEDLRWRAIWMKEMLGFQVDEVAAALWMSPRTIVPLKLSLVPFGDRGVEPVPTKREGSFLDEFGNIPITLWNKSNARKTNSKQTR